MMKYNSLFIFSVPSAFLLLPRSAPLDMTSYPLPDPPRNAPDSSSDTSYGADLTRCSQSASKSPSERTSSSSSSSSSPPPPGRTMPLSLASSAREPSGSSARNSAARSIAFFRAGTSRTTKLYPVPGVHPPRAIASANDGYTAAAAASLPPPSPSPSPSSPPMSITPSTRPHDPSSCICSSFSRSRA